MFNFSQKFVKLKALSLIELIVAVGIFVTIAAVMISASVVASFDASNSAERIQARYLAQESYEAVRSIQANDFDDLTEGTFGLDTSSGYWEFSGTGNTIGDFERTITVSKINNYKYDVTVDVTWTSADGNPIAISSASRFTNWKALFFMVDTQGEFDGGGYNSVESTASGSVQFKTIGSWDNTTVTVDEDISGSNRINEIFIDDNYLYLAQDDGGSYDDFVLYDISDVSRGNITKIDGVNLGDDANDFVIHEGYAYVATDNSLEIKVVRLSDFTKIADWDIPSSSNANSVAIYGTGLVVVTDYSTSEEAYLLDITDPTVSNAIISDSYEFDDLHYDVEVHNGYAYIASDGDTSEIEVLRLSDFTDVNSYDASGSDDAYSIFIDTENDIAYLARDEGSPEFVAVDISSPEGTLSTLGTNSDADEDANDVYVYDGYAYLATDDSNEEVIVIDLSDYSKVAAVDTSDSSDLEAIWFQGAHIYAGTSDSNRELRVFESGTSSGGWGTPLFLETENPSGDQNMYATFVDDGYLYSGRDGDSDSGVYEFNVYSISASGTVGSPVGTYNLNEDVNEIFVLGDYAYLANNKSNDEFLIMDVSTKSSPTLVSGGDYDLDEDGTAVWVYSTGSGTFAAVGSEDSDDSDPEFFLFDVSTPSNPILRDSVNIGDEVNDIVVNGNYAYVATEDNSDEVYIYEISDPYNIREIASINHSGNGNANGLYYDTTDDTLHIAFDDYYSYDNYAVYDVSNPASPSELDGIEFDDDINGVVLHPSSDLAFLVGDDWNEEFMVVDISNTSSLSEIVTFDLNADGNDIASNGTYLYIASEHDSQEIQVLQATPASASTYSKFGIYTSAAHDSSSASTSWGLLTWNLEDSSGGGGGSSSTFVDDSQSEFDAGSYSNTAWDTDHVELSAGQTSGTFSSDIFDSTDATSTWDQISWTEDLSAAGLVMEVGSTTATSSFTTVNLTETYIDPVVIPFMHESANSGPVSVRLTSVGSSSFQIKLESPDGTSPSSETVHYIVVEEGAWTMPDGTTLEAGTLDTGTVAYKNNWSGTDVNFSSSFSSAPIVLHNVQTNNDPSWIESAIFSQSSRSAPPTTTGFEMALNGAEAETSHASETIGWIAIEAGSGTLEGVDFEAVITSDTVRGHGNGCNTFTFTGTYASSPLVISKQQEMDGNDGGWAVGCSLSNTQIGLHSEEDQESDSERNHTTETFAYVAFESAVNFSVSVDLSFQARSCDDAACSGESFAGSFTTPGGESPGVSANQYFQYQGTFTSNLSGYTPELSLFTTTYTIPGSGSGTSGTGVTFQTRTASASGSLTTATWVGPDASSGSFYEASDSNIVISGDSSGTRYFNFAAYFSGTGSSTPVLEDVTAGYTQ